MKIFKEKLNRYLTLRINFTKKVRLKSGFTLIETMVAVFILTLALSALLNLVTSSLFAARYARNEITANYLAQGAADYIRNKRDSLAFKENTNGGWSTFLNDFGANTNTNTLCFSSDGCYFDVNVSSPIIRACSGDCPYFKYRNSGNSFYYYSTNSSQPTSNFRRKIKMTRNGSDEVYVTVTVYWRNGNLNRSKVLNFSLLKWLGT